MTADEIRTWAAKSATEIVKREGVALVMSACDRDGTAVEADSNLLGVAIAQAHKLSDLPVPGASLGCLAVGVCYVAQV